MRFGFMDVAAEVSDTQYKPPFPAGGPRRLLPFAFDFRRLGPPPRGTWCHVSIWVYIAKSGEGIRRVLGSDPGRSHYHEDKDILVAVGLRGGLDPFRQGEESFCQRRANTYGILQKRVGKTCEDQGPSLARLHLFFACHGLGFGASARP